LSSQGVLALPSDWAGWQRFSRRFVTAEGRVVDRTFGGKTTSEGQSYGLFFALVAGDRRRFEQIRRWTAAELAGGKLGERLPGWLWALRDDGTWGLKDANSAADADLWLAYTLLEAGRHWQEPRYTAQGTALLASIAAHEVVELDGGRVLLLPAPSGFDLGGGRYRFNPSYLPGFLFLALGTYDPAGPWERIWATYQELAPQMFPAGVAPDLCIIDRHGRVFVDRETAAVGSYDAIRVYLWAGLSPAGPRSVLPLLHGLVPLMQEYGMPPEKLDAMTGRATAVAFSPPGFQGAVLPYLSAVEATELLAGQQRRVETHIAAAKMGAATQYYDEALILFGAGWQERRYRFDEDGHLVLPPGR
jgi:endoglucanase